MIIKARNEVLEKLKDALKNANKTAVRLDVAGFGWAGPTFEIVLDEQKDNDDVFEIEGVKFVAEAEFGFLIQGVEVVSLGNEFALKDNGGC